MKRKILLYLSIAIIAIIAIAAMGCQTDSGGPESVGQKSLGTETKNIKFYYQDGTPALTVAKLAKENPEIHENITIDYVMQKSPDLLVAEILKEEADIAIIPSNLAAQTFNKDLSYKIVGTPTWGAMYLTSTEDIKEFEDLKGKEIYTFGKGLTPDLVLRYVLSKNDIDPDTDVKITYLNSASEMGPAFLSGKTNLAVLPEPLLTVVMSKNEDAKVIFDLNQEWSNASAAEKGFPQSSLVIKTELIEDNIEFVESFIDNFEASRKWAIENQDELGEYAEELEISVPKDIIKKGIRWTNPEDFTINDSHSEYEIYYDAILDFAPDFIGGKAPSEDLYFER
jgi:NitT/TauT family transport system substrate-binding protein